MIALVAFTGCRSPSTPRLTPDESWLRAEEAWTERLAIVRDVVEASRLADEQKAAFRDRVYGFDQNVTLGVASAREGLRALDRWESEALAAP